MDKTYIPKEFKQKRLNPEEQRIVKELPENQICEQCHKVFYECGCDVF